jgi:oligopeptide transport system ATP-binding protein
MDSLLSLVDYGVTFATPEGEVRAVSGMDLSIGPGERLAIVGESGSGKSQTFLGVMGLLARNGRTSGRAEFGGQNLLELAPRALDAIRGNDIAMVFQDPMTALNPSLRISRQLTEQLEVHQGLSSRAASDEALSMLARVGIPDPERRFRLYPHELSGGMRQRVVIAMALLCRPRLLIADEPTTALDVTIQAQILDLFADLARETGTAMVTITHDMGVVAGIADRVVVMYGGRTVEDSLVDDIFARPAHPYTEALLRSIPRVDVGKASIAPIPGHPPNLIRLPRGCAFHPRCRRADTICTTSRPELLKFAGSARVACHHTGAEGNG